MITVFGSINLDLIGRVSRIPKPGETVPGTSFASAPGGKGANQALAARRAGASVRMVGATGGDGFAVEALALLKASGVDLGSVSAVEGPTGIAMILVDDEGENVVAVLPGANGIMSALAADAALSGLIAGNTLILQQEVPQDATRRALEVARSRGARSILNTAPFLPTTVEVTPLASIVVANETEFALLAGDGDLETQMRGWARAKRQTVIVTLGPDGARAATPDGFLSIPAMKVRPVDTVGAGDTFVGYLAAGLDAGLALEAAMRRAAAAASLACLKPGAQPSIPTTQEVEAALSSGSR
ncbi:MAG: ribokinase [Devosia sp.]